MLELAILGTAVLGLAVVVIAQMFIDWRDEG